MFIHSASRSSVSRAGEALERGVSRFSTGSSRAFARELERTSERQTSAPDRPGSGRTVQTETGQTNPASTQLAVSLAPNPFNPRGGVVTADAVSPAAQPAAMGIPANPPQAAGRPGALLPVTPDTSKPPLDVLKAALAEMGIGVDGLPMREERVIVSSPMGSYENHDIAVDFGGYTERYSVRLMLQNPNLAAFEIERRRAELAHA